MRVHSLESMAAVDGEGLRFAVFLPGCPLRCAYCHNPDTWETAGTEYTEAELLRKLYRYKPYFGTKGGVTFSGGEPLLHAAEIHALARRLSAEGIRYALDTSGCVPLTEDVRSVVRGAQLILLDLKFPDADSWRKWTGGEFAQQQQLWRFAREENKRIWIRTVVVPGVNDSEEALDRYLAVYRKLGAERYQLLGFHTMGFFKYAQLGIANPLAGTPAMDPEKLDCLQAYVDKYTKTKI